MTADERPPSSEDMIRMAREAVASPPAGPPEPEPVPESRAAPEPVTRTSRRPLARSDRSTRIASPRSSAEPSPEVVRNAPRVAALAMVIGLIVLALAMYLALAAATP